MVRGVLVLGLVILPTLLLRGVGADHRPVLALVALFTGTLVYIEYRAAYPSLMEFRDAPPYNRVRYLMLLTMVLLLSIAGRAGPESSPIVDLVAAICTLCGYALDSTFSPVRMITNAVTQSGGDVAAARAAAGTAMLVALLFLGGFVLVLRRNPWPARETAFNVWVNLPTFDPNFGGDVVRRLERDARFNLALGIALPFLLPPLLHAAAQTFGAMDLSVPQARIWVISAWAFLPASLFMRGIALGRIARMIRDRRAQAVRMESGDYATV